MAASSNGNFVAIGDSKGYTTVYDVETKSKKCYFCLHQNKVMDICFSSDGEWVVSLGFDRIVAMGNIADTKVFRKL